MRFGFDTRALMLCVAALPWLGLPRPALATESDGPAVVAEIKALDQATLDKAETLFFQALGHYRKDRFEQAAVDFQKAFVLTNHRDLLFNIARSREKLGDKDGAIEWYRAYLATSPADETAVIHRISELGGDPTPEPADLGRIAGDVDIDPPLAEPSASPLPWIVLGLGVAAAGAGTYFGLDALDQASQARAAETRGATTEFKDGAEQSALIADISFVAGAVAVGTAVLLWTLSDHEASAGRVDLGASPDGGYVGYSLTF